MRLQGLRGMAASWAQKLDLFMRTGVPTKNIKCEGAGWSDLQSRSNMSAECSGGLL